MPSRRSLAFVVLSVLLAAPLARAAEVAEWDFDALDSLTDRVGTIVGAVSGEVTLVDSGAGAPDATGFNKAYDFQGNAKSVYVNLGSSAVATTISNFAAGPFTVAGWFDADERNSGDNYRWIIGNLGETGGFVVHLGKPDTGSTRGRLHVSVGAGDNQVTFRSTQRYDIDDDKTQWHWFAATSDGSTLSVYVDGKLLGTAAYKPGTTASPDPGSTALVGRAFDGRIDQLSVWNEQLTADHDDRGVLAAGPLFDLWRQSMQPRAATPGITTTEVTIFDGEKGWHHDGVFYRLACGVNLVQTPSGELLATWLSGTDSEPSTDNCILASRSTDGGWTWSEPWIMVAAGEHAGGLTNLFVGEDNKLHAFGAYWPSEDEYMTWYYFRMTSDDDGRTWSSREPFTLFNNHAALGQRIQLDDGRWLYPASIFLRRDKPLHGDFKHMAMAKNEAEAQALAQQFPEPHPDKFARVLHGCMSFCVSDRSAEDLTPGGSVSNRPMGLIEPTVVQLKDGTVVMLMRAQTGGFLWESRSFDRGQSWTPAVQTDIPNPSALTYLLRLNDGRIALFHNPTGGVIGGYGPRNPLAMWLSDDEMRSWSVKYNIAGSAKCAYPIAIETTEGKLLVGYDRNRREARVIHVDFDAATSAN